MEIIITADLIEAYLKCPTKCFLLSRDEVETGNAYAGWAPVKSASFCREGIGRLVAGVAPNKCVMSASATENPQWQLAIDFKARSQNLQCSCQALERIPSVGTGESGTVHTDSIRLSQQRRGSRR